MEAPKVTEEYSVSQADFVAWKNDLVTKFIFKHLKDVAEFTLERMTSKELIGNPNGLLRLNELRGYVDAIEDMLNINPVSEEEGVNYDSESKSTGLPDFS